MGAERENRAHELVPTSRKVNGKTLTKDVTLTAADIKMPDSEEDVGAAMAKRPLMLYPKALDVHKITSGQLYWCDADTSNTPYKTGLTEYQQGVALCTARSAEENGVPSSIYRMQKKVYGSKAPIKADGQTGCS